MPRDRIWIPSVEIGEFAPDLSHRTDLAVRNKGLLKARNIRLNNGGGWQRRWGTKKKVTHAGVCRYEEVGIGAVASVLFAFSDSRLEIYDVDWNLLQTITTGCPWDDTNLFKMSIAAEANKITIASFDFMPVEITRESGVWSIATVIFTQGRGNSTKQPYWRFQKRGVTLTPSGLTGTINLLTSESYFKPAHVGTKIRYQSQEILITAYTDDTHATGSVISALYPTITVPITSSTGFNVGDVVQGEDSLIYGVVVSIPTSTSLVVTLTQGYAYFTGGTTNENLIGPNQRSALTGACTATTTASSNDWDEQLISPLRGYPNGVAYHRGRRIFMDFPNATNLIAASTTNDTSDYDVGLAETDDAIIVTIGRDDTLRVKYIASAEQMLLFTDAGVYYVPETVGAPFSPSNIEFFRAGTRVCAEVVPLQIDEGVLFCERDSGRLLMCKMTGNVRGSWEILDLSELAYHFMLNPKELATAPATYNTDREIIILREDGKIISFKLAQGQSALGSVLWETQGYWESVAVLNGSIRLCAKRQLSSIVYWGEEMSKDCVTDGVEYSNVLTWSALASQNIILTKDNQFLANLTLSNTGTCPTFEKDWGSIGAGFNYNVLVEYPSPINGENGQYRLMSISYAKLTVEDSGQYRMNNYTMAAYQTDSDESELAPLITGSRSTWVRGWEDDPTIIIEQDIPNPLNIKAITMEVKS